MNFFQKALLISSVSFAGLVADKDAEAQSSVKDLQKIGPELMKELMEQTNPGQPIIVRESFNPKDNLEHSSIMAVSSDGKYMVTVETADYNHNHKADLNEVLGVSKYATPKKYASVSLERDAAGQETTQTIHVQSKKKTLVFDETRDKMTVKENPFTVANRLTSIFLPK
jgi:hypothetical protein